MTTIRQRNRRYDRTVGRLRIEKIVVSKHGAAVASALMEKLKLNSVSTSFRGQSVLFFKRTAHHEITQSARENPENSAPAASLPSEGGVQHTPESVETKNTQVARYEDCLRRRIFHQEKAKYYFRNFKAVREYASKTHQL